MLTELRPLQVKDEVPFREAVNEFKIHNPDWDFAFRFDSSMPFADYVNLVQGWPQGIGIGAFVPNTYLVALRGNKIVGRVSLRHELNASLLRVGGHLGYGIVPSERRKGYAKDLLRMTLPIAKQLGLKKILLTCDDDNEGSWRTIEAGGGILENKLMDEGKRVPTRRYWIDLSS